MNIVIKTTVTTEHGSVLAETVQTVTTDRSPTMMSAIMGIPAVISASNGVAQPIRLKKDGTPAKRAGRPPKSASAPVPTARPATSKRKPGRPRKATTASGG